MRIRAIDGSSRGSVRLLDGLFDGVLAGLFDGVLAGLFDGVLAGAFSRYAGALSRSRASR
jgi:hypothetical protein